MVGMGAMSDSVRFLVVVIGFSPLGYGSNTALYQGHMCILAYGRGDCQAHSDIINSKRGKGAEQDERRLRILSHYPARVTRLYHKRGRERDRFPFAGKSSARGAEAAYPEHICARRGNRD